ncbi:MAG: methylated-DNA--[protein]-cysteine S-methyltransferase [Verrucomicrobia bacterium]|nr:methylated-DNA--[protein]-cysteine S-methyltransferase [Verrucomicrobiota bacterium]
MNYQIIYHSPIGKLKLVSDGEYLIELHFGKRTDEAEPVVEPGQEKVKPFPEVIRQLDEYFEGKRTEFDVPIRFVGTPFQVRAWEALKSIPFGETISYKEEARRVGSVPRAVGLANGQNPIPIIVPCHRVIGADGSLVGFGGGLDLKRALLSFEATVHDFGPQPFAPLKSCSKARTSSAA